jgi:hypothetical protein
MELYDKNSASWALFDCFAISVIPRNKCHVLGGKRLGY